MECLITRKHTLKILYKSKHFLQSSGGSSYGRSGRPPNIDQNLGLALAARLRHGDKFSLKSLTFGHFLCKNVQKAFSFRGATRQCTGRESNVIK